ncbi:MAG: DUF2312 domain-containing protein [Alphaproteobacteria bacterium]
MSEIGHNSGLEVASGQLKAILDRVESLDEDRVAIMVDMKDVYAEAKGNGFDVKAIKRLVVLRRQDRSKLLEDNAILELYATALGCLDLI